MLAINNLPFSLETVTRLPAPPRLPADLYNLASECRAGLSAHAVHCIETAARSERKRDAAARKCFISRLIQSTLKGM